MKNLTWQNPEQLFVAQELINKVKSKCCGIKVKVICFVASCHNFLYRGLSSVVIVVKEVIVVKVICFVDSYHNFIITAFGNVPAARRASL